MLITVIEVLSLTHYITKSLDSNIIASFRIITKYLFDMQKQHSSVLKATHFKIA